MSNFSVVALFEWGRKPQSTAAALDLHAGKRVGMKTYHHCDSNVRGPNDMLPSLWYVALVGESAQDAR